MLFPKCVLEWVRVTSAQSIMAVQEKLGHTHLVSAWSGDALAGAEATGASPDTSHSRCVPPSRRDDSSAAVIPRRTHQMVPHPSANNLAVPLEELPVVRETETVSQRLIFFKSLVSNLLRTVARPVDTGVPHRSTERQAIARQRNGVRGQLASGIGLLGRLADLSRWSFSIAVNPTKSYLIRLNPSKSDLLFFFGFDSAVHPTNFNRLGLPNFVYYEISIDIV